MATQTMYASGLICSIVCGECKHPPVRISLGLRKMVAPGLWITTKSWGGAAQPVCTSWLISIVARRQREKGLTPGPISGSFLLMGIYLPSHATNGQTHMKNNLLRKFF